MQYPMKEIFLFDNIEKLKMNHCIIIISLVGTLF